MSERVRLLVEGVETSDGRLIEAGAIVWKDEPLPVYSYEADDEWCSYSHLTGQMTEIRREDDGSITGLVETDLTITTECDDVDSHTCDGVFVIRRARLRAGCQSSKESRWPWPNYPQRQEQT